MSQYKAYYYCSFCDAESEIVLSEAHLTKPRQCEDCFRVLILDSSERIGPAEPSTPNELNLQSIFSDLAQSMTAPATANPSASQTLSRQRAPIFHLITRLAEALGPSLEGETAGSHPDFIKFLTDNAQVVSPYESHTLAIHCDLYNHEFIFPTVAEFGVQYKQLVDILTYVENSSNSESVTPLSNNLVDIMAKFAFEEYNEDQHTFLKGQKSLDIPFGTYVLYQSSLFLPSQPHAITGKGITFDQYTNIYNEYIERHNLDDKFLILNEFQPDGLNMNSESSPVHTYPPICVFQRGDISFGAKTLLIPTPYNMAKSQKKTSPSTISPTVMLVCDTTTNSAQWPFVMTDSGKIADPTILSLMISQQISSQILARLQQKQYEPTQSTLPCNITLLLMQNDAFSCAICRCAFETGDEYVKLACKHTYHKQCILHWLDKKNTCPVCRYQLPPLLSVEDDSHEPINNTNFRDFFM